MGGRISDDSIKAVILSLLPGELNKAGSRMSSLRVIVSTLAEFPCVDQTKPTGGLKCVQAVI